jgi:hypothetical protein
LYWERVSEFSLGDRTCAQREPVYSSMVAIMLGDQLNKNDHDLQNSKYVGEDVGFLNRNIKFVVALRVLRNKVSLFQTATSHNAHNDYFGISYYNLIATTLHLNHEYTTPHTFLKGHSQ